MIKDNFYSTVTTWDILPESMEFTAYVPNIPITDRPAPNAYWLGWISIDNLPQGLHVSEIRLNNNGYDFIDITPQENFDCGYSFRVPPTSAYVSDRPIRISYYRDSISKWSSTAGTANSNNFCFANKANVMAISNGGVELFCSYIIYNSTGETIVARNLSSSSMLFARFTHAEWLAFLNGTNSIAFSANNATVEISKEDLETGTFYKEMSDGTFIRFFLVGYNFIPNRTTYLSGSRWYDRPSSTPAFMVHINTEYYGDAIVTGCNTTQSTVTYWNNNNPAAVLDSVVLRGCKGYFSFETISNLNYNASPYAWNETTLIFRQDSNAVNWVQAIFPIAEIEKHYNLNIRSSAIESAQRPFYGYTENNVYAPYVKDDNEFTATRITGNLEDAEFQSKLRLWQYDATQWEENDYTEDDKPEYEPGEEGENIGDKITRPTSIGVGGTNGFVTQYALNRSDVAQLGALLWTSFVDQDYWQNFLFSLALDTGTLQLSGLLNFFVSMKVYPFSLRNIAGYQGFGQDMYVGTGIIPLHFSTNIGVLSNYCDYISGGHIDIPRYFNDYRDYINTEISLYLPFCGTVQLNPGDVIGNRIDIQYAIDFATGGCIAYVDLTTGDGAGYPVGALPGQIGADIPLTATAAGEVAARFIGDGLNVAGMIGGEVGRIGSGVAGALGGNPSGGSGGGSVFAGVAGMYGGAGAAMAADLAPGLAQQGIQVLQRGAVGAPMLSGGRGFAAFGAPSKPYVQIRRGIYPEVSGLHTVAGAPAAATTTISSLSGFIKGSVKADGLSCHQAEKEEIIALIASGIYV